MKRTRRVITPAEREILAERIGKLLESGHSHSEILAAVTECNNAMITEVRRDRGIGKRSRKVELMEIEIKRLHERGMGVTEIAAEIGKPASTVSRAMRRAGISVQQINRPVLIFGEGVMLSPKRNLKKLQEQFPQVTWKIARRISKHTDEITDQE